MLNVIKHKREHYNIYFFLLGKNHIGVSPLGAYMKDVHDVPILLYHVPTYAHFTFLTMSVKLKEMTVLVVSCLI